ncbi:hypothetical protein Nepgr_000101 [Nepenthes gracilis]|uniref:CCHC-type domain-containing protein n=1 Tax=Nepenthes gracilis TaxID=150966 RepID=A0AAD3RVA4_NEPGR|nr:hypothetical protein Nepgr_000101 [Nepenthes gracilis]
MGRKQNAGGPKKQKQTQNATRSLASFNSSVLGFVSLFQFPLLLLLSSVDAPYATLVRENRISGFYIQISICRQQRVGFSAIGYDPYAPNKDDSIGSSHNKNPEPEGENAYASFQGLLALARITGSNDNEARGACKKCGRVGHLTYQCRNFLSVKVDSKDKDEDAIRANVLLGLDKLKASVGKVSGKTAAESSEECSEGDDSESSDSSVDLEIERILAEREGKKTSSKSRALRKKKVSSDDEGYDSGDRKRRGRSKKRRSMKRSGINSDDEVDDRRKSNKEKRRKRDEPSDEDEERQHRRRKGRKEKRSRRSHRHSDDSEESPSQHRRKSRRTASPSESDDSGPDESRFFLERSVKKCRIVWNVVWLLLFTALLTLTNCTR